MARNLELEKDIAHFCETVGGQIGKDGSPADPDNVPVAIQYAFTDRAYGDINPFTEKKRLRFRWYELAWATGSEDEAPASFEHEYRLSIVNDYHPSVIDDIRHKINFRLRSVRPVVAATGGSPKDVKKFRAVIDDLFHALDKVCRSVMVVEHALHMVASSEARDFAKWVSRMVAEDGSLINRDDVPFVINVLYRPQRNGTPLDAERNRKTIRFRWYEPIDMGGFSDNEDEDGPPASLTYEYRIEIIDDNYQGPLQSWVYDFNERLRYVRVKGPPRVEKKFYSTIADMFHALMNICVTVNLRYVKKEELTAVRDKSSGSGKNKSASVSARDLATEAFDVIEETMFVRPVRHLSVLPVAFDMGNGAVFTVVLRLDASKRNAFYVYAKQYGRTVPQVETAIARNPLNAEPFASDYKDECVAALERLITSLATVRSGAAAADANAKLSLIVFGVKGVTTEDDAQVNQPVRRVTLS